MRNEDLQPAEQNFPPSEVLRQIKNLAGPDGFQSYSVSNGSRRLAAIYGGGLAPRVVVIEPVAAYGGVHFVREQYSFTHSGLTPSISSDVAAYFFDPSDNLQRSDVQTLTAEQRDLIQRKKQELKDEDSKQRLKDFLTEAQAAIPVNFPIELLY